MEYGSRLLNGYQENYGNEKCRDMLDVLRLLQILFSKALANWSTTFSSTQALSRKSFSFFLRLTVSSSFSGNINDDVAYLDKK